MFEQRSLEVCVCIDNKNITVADQPCRVNSAQSTLAQRILLGHSPLTPQSTRPELAPQPRHARHRTRLP